MKVQEIIMTSMVDDLTRIAIANRNGKFLAKGNWYNDDVLSSMEYEVYSCLYQAAFNSLRITVIERENEIFEEPTDEVEMKG